jgi:hypothetical protein
VKSGEGPRGSLHPVGSFLRSRVDYGEAYIVELTRLAWLLRYQRHKRGAPRNQVLARNYQIEPVQSIVAQAFDEGSTDRWAVIALRQRTPRKVVSKTRLEVPSGCARNGAQVSAENNPRRFH